MCEGGWLGGFLKSLDRETPTTGNFLVFSTPQAAVSLGGVCAAMVKVDRILIVATSRELLGDTAIKTGAWCALQALRQAMQLRRARVETTQQLLQTARMATPCCHPCTFEGCAQPSRCMRQGGGAGGALLHVPAAWRAPKRRMRCSCSCVGAPQWHTPRACRAGRRPRPAAQATRWTSRPSGAAACPSTRRRCTARTRARAPSAASWKTVGAGRRALEHCFLIVLHHLRSSDHIQAPVDSDQTAGSGCAACRASALGMIPIDGERVHGACCNADQGSGNVFARG
jgi:hypothetical protein